jgi:uncharacterized protein
MVARLLKALIRLYQLTLSPVLGAHCRFHPTCSTYFMQALDEHGFWRGCGLGLRRILRCHPWHPGGYDPVPPRRTKDGEETSHE